MKKFKKIVLSLLVLSVFFLCCYGNFQEFKTVNQISSKLKNNPFLFIPILYTFLSFVSFLFSIQKFSNVQNSKALYYRILRVTDFIFALSLIILFIVVLYSFIDSVNENTETSKSIIYTSTILILSLVFGFVLLIDNILFHRNNLKNLKVDNIDEIGK